MIYSFFCIPGGFFSRISEPSTVSIFKLQTANLSCRDHGICDRSLHSGFQKCLDLGGIVFWWPWMASSRWWKSIEKGSLFFKSHWISPIDQSLMFECLSKICKNVWDTSKMVHYFCALPFSPRRRSPLVNLNIMILGTLPSSQDRNGSILLVRTGNQTKSMLSGLGSWGKPPKERIPSHETRLKIWLISIGFFLLDFQKLPVHNP